MNKVFLSCALLVLVVHQGGASCPTVRRGSRGSCVETVQRAVGVTADGIFGSNTDAAVRRFQSRHGLAVDGIVGPNTWAKIRDVSSSSSGSSGIITNSCGCSVQGATGCSDGPTTGATKLAAYLKHTYGGRTEIYNCRQVRGGSSYSLHSEGRAIDLYASEGKMAQVWNDMRAIACQVGIQRVIYARQIWDAARGVRYYGGQHPHYDHVHIELNRCAATAFDWRQ